MGKQPGQKCQKEEFPSSWKDQSQKDVVSWRKERDNERRNQGEWKTKDCQLGIKGADKRSDNLKVNKREERSNLECGMFYAFDIDLSINMK